MLPAVGTAKGTEEQGKTFQAHKGVSCIMKQLTLISKAMLARAEPRLGSMNENDH